MVVDASVVATAIIETRSAAAGALAEAEFLAAPGLLDLEVIQVIRRKVNGEVLSPEDGLQAVRRLGQLPVARYAHGSLLDRVWALRSNLTAYDAAYVALAERLGTALLTADARLARAPGLSCRVEIVR